MKTNWQTKKLGEICEITTGNSNTVDAIDNGKYAFFDRSKTIKRSNRFLFDSEALIIPGEGAEFFPRFYRGKFDIDIKTAKTNAKKIINLDEKLKAQREIKDWEKKRNEMRRRLFETQDEVELKKEKLFESVKARLLQTSKIEPLFTIKWEII